MQYKLIFIPLLVVIVTQIIKLSIDKIKGNMNLKGILISYGGMPSAHTAFVCSVTTVAALHSGLDSMVFVVSLVFTILIMRDAVTFRNFLGQQGAVFNELVKKIDPKSDKNLPHFTERLGHSISEVVVGAVWGASSTALLYFLI